MNRNSPQKRKRGDSYDRNYNKKLKESGLAYLTRKQVYVDAKLPPSREVVCKCQLSCKSIPHERKLELFSKFYTLLGNEKGTYIMSLIKIVPVQRRRHGCYQDPNESRRQASVQYFIPFTENEYVRVCKNTLIDIFKVTRKQLTGFIERKKVAEEEFTDGRGKNHRHKYEFTDFDKELVQEHINFIAQQEYNIETKSHLNINLLFKSFRRKYPQSQVNYKNFSTTVKENYPTLHFNKKTKMCNECDFLCLQINIQEQKLTSLRKKLEMHQMICETGKIENLIKHEIFQV